MLSARLIFRCFHTTFFAKGRYRQLNDDPGVKRRMKMFAEDDEYKREIDEDEDISGLESDFHNVDLMYKEHKRETFKKRQYEGNKITTKKFFSGPKPPNMLTWAERLQIINLHEKDPEEWSLDSLSESFPASRATISKILNTKWKPDNINKMKQKDKVVHENWQLLAENKLEADPELLNHFQKFLPRREEFLASIQNNEVIQLFEKPEPKKIWNNGQMSSILESYDNSLRIIDEKQKIKQGLIENKDCKEILTERINDEFFENGNIDSFKLGSGDKPSKLTTLSELKNNVKSRESENLLENAITESSKKERGEHINERLAKLAGYSLYGATQMKETKNKIRTKTNDFEAIEVANETQLDSIIKTENNFSSNKDQKKKNHSRFAELAGYSNEYIQKFTDTNGIVNNNNEKTKDKADDNLSSFKSLKSTSEDFIEDRRQNNKGVRSNQDENCKNNFGSLTEELTKGTDTHYTEQSSQSEDLEVTKTYDFKSERDKEEFEAEEKSISQTFFWNNANKDEHSQQEISVTSLYENKLKPESAALAVEYAERIKIPRDKKGSGLTFRVKDCYYDDDGEFLYRVPGMTKTDEN